MRDDTHRPPVDGARPLQAEDLLQLRLISEAQISPDGRRICYVQTVMDPEENAYRSHLWMVDAEGGEVRKLTNSVGPAYSPTFSPDGRTIAYLGHARQYADYTQPSIWTVPAEGGEQRDVTADFDRPFGD